MFRKTKIIGTVGPASSDEKVFRELVENGLNVARLNFSHGTHVEHLKVINTIKGVREELGKDIAIILDTKGPEIRTGIFPEPVQLVEGEIFTLTTDDVLGSQTSCKISYSKLPLDISIGDKILIDDGLICLEVLSKTEREIETKILNGGVVSSNKGVNVPSVALGLPAITPKDVEDIKFGIDNGIDYIAMSFVRTKEDVLEVRKITENYTSHHVDIIAKIENQQGVENIESILEVSDGIMVARGDLGVEIPTENVPIVQKKLIEICNREGKPVITATQMLDSMIRNPRPTRAEATDVANAIFDGTDAIMLSGETAVGKYPVQAVKTMARIALAAEKELNYEEILDKNMKMARDSGVTIAVSHATARAALDLNAAAIITATSSGFTAKKVSKLRPLAPIVACTTSDEVCRKLSLVWGVCPLKIKDTSSTDEIFELSLQASKHAGYIHDGDLVIISAGVPVGLSGATNIMKIQLVGELLIKGTGLLKAVISGRAVVGSSKQELESLFEEGDIIVATSTDRDMVEYIAKAGGLIVEEGGYTSHGAIAALNLKIPCIVGAKDATNLIKSGTNITLNSTKGIVYSGKVRTL